MMRRAFFIDTWVQPAPPDEEDELRADATHAAERFAAGAASAAETPSRPGQPGTSSDEAASQHAAGGATCEAAQTGLVALPSEMVLPIAALLPADAKLRFAATCRTVRALLSDRRLWHTLDLSCDSGVCAAVTDNLLVAAAARAGGELRALNVSHAERITPGSLLAVTRANAGSLRTLHAHSWLTSQAHLEALLLAVPTLAALHADVACTSREAHRLLRSEPPFGPLRLLRLHVEARAGGELDAAGLVSSLAEHASLTELTLSHVRLGLGTFLEELVEHATLPARLNALRIKHSDLSPDIVATLARLLSHGTLRTLELTGMRLPHDSGMLADALRACTSLTSLTLRDMRLWEHNATAGAMLVEALVGHPSLRTLRLNGNKLPFCSGVSPRAVLAGAALGALVAADAPALAVLDVSDCSLRDAGLGPLCDALQYNANLRELVMDANCMSSGFARARMLPALRANAGLRSLRAGFGELADTAAQLVRARTHGTD